VDEVLIVYGAASGVKCVVHDHLYSPVALLNLFGNTIFERYEYDAYGEPNIMDASYNPRATSLYGNPYMFTGRRVDYLDSGSLKIQFNRNRYYDYYTGRWTTHDPIGYADGMNLYEYVQSRSLTSTDPWGMEIFENLRETSYSVGLTPPPDGDWEHGDWKAISTWNPLILARLRAWQLLGAGNAIAGYLSMIPHAAIDAFGGSGAVRLGFLDAANLLNHYLDNKGTTINISYIRMLRDSRHARNTFLKAIKNAQSEAERLLEDKGCNAFVSMVQDGYIRGQVTDNQNWHYAVKTYHTWGRGGVRRKDCDYEMTWTLHLRDNYEFANAWNWAGLVWDKWMWELNAYGWAKHFKTRGSYRVKVRWSKGDRFDAHDVWRMIRRRDRRLRR